jgi:hypothetical protein
MPGKCYTVQYRDSLNEHEQADGWAVLTNIPPQAAASVVEAIDARDLNVNGRYYRAVTPPQQ